MKKIAIALLSTVTAVFLVTVLWSFKSRNNVTGKLSTSAKGGKFYFLFLSDIHRETGLATTGKNDDAGDDLWPVFKLKLDSILKSPNPPAFILFTGDLPGHDGTDSQRRKNISSVLTDLHDLSAARKTPVFYLPGNNDALSGDYCYFSDQDKKTPFSLIENYSPYPYQAFNVADRYTKNGAYMLPCANLAAGYCTVQAMRGLRVICLNTVLWSISVGSCEAKANCINEKQALDEMNWLEHQLADAAKAGDKVYLAMHIPPGVDAYSSKDTTRSPVMMWTRKSPQTDWQARFLKNVAQYQKAIAGIFYGHTHMDEFRLLYNSAGDKSIMQAAISCPGISPGHRNNPGFKLVEIDPDSKQPVNFTTYYTSIQPVRWQQPYSFTQLPGVGQGLTIADALRKMTPKERKAALDSIYTVKNKITMSYDVLGMDVR